MYTKLIKKIRRAERNHYRKRHSAPFRLAVFRSNCHFYVQLIEDTKGHTVFSASTLSKGFERSEKRQLNSRIISSLGEFFNSNIPVEYKGAKVVFDKSCYTYHGLVKTFAEKAREVLNF